MNDPREPRPVMHEDAKFVSFEEAHEYGYHGRVPDMEDNEVYTLAGVTKDADKDQPVKAVSRPTAKQTANKEADK